MSLKRKLIRYLYFLSLGLFINFFGNNRAFSQYYPGGLGNSNLQIWLNANKASSLTYNASNQVSQWNDLSGNGYNFSQSITSQMPVYSFNAGPNARPAVLYSSTNSQFLTLPSLPASMSFSSGQSNMAMLSFFPTNSNWNKVICFGNGQQSSNIDYGRYYNTNNFFSEGYVGGYAQTYTTTNPINPLAFNLFESVQAGGTPGNTSTVSFYSAGSPQSSTGQLGSSITYIPNSITRTQNYIGKSSWTSDSYFDGILSEILFFNTALSTTQRIILENYLATEWGTTISSTKFTPPTSTSYNQNLVGIGYTNSSDFVLSNPQNTLNGSTDGLGFSSGSNASDFLNASNPGYIMGAHNGQANTVLTGKNLTGIGSNLSYWNRSWYIMKNGGNASGNISLNFNFQDYNASSPAFGATYALLFNSSDGSFSSGTNSILVNAGTVNGFTVSFAVPASKIANGYYTLLTIPNTTISYPASFLCTNNGTVSPTITGLPGGTFSTSATGLSLDPSTGQINLATSTPGVDTVFYTYDGGALTTNQRLIISAPPTAYTVGGGGAYCLGGHGNITLSKSDYGINYQLYLNGVPTSTILVGTGAELSFPASANGTYTLVGSNSYTTCSTLMNGSVTTTSTSLPSTFTVSGGGAYCSGGTGVTIKLSGSQTGVNYQFEQQGLTAQYWNNVDFAGTPVASQVEPNVNYPYSTGGFGPSGVYPTAYSTRWTGYIIAPVSGNYTFKTLSDDGIRLWINGNLVLNDWSNHVTATDSSGLVNLTAGQIYPINLEYYQGLGGTQAQLEWSYPGQSTQIIPASQFLTANISGQTVAGTGNPISFTNITGAGTYQVIATNATGCQTIMSGSASVSLNPLPNIYPVTTSTNTICSGSTAYLSIPNSDQGVNYQVLLNGAPYGSLVPGEGFNITITFPVSSAGTYTIQAINASTGCSQLMNGSIPITVNPLPTQFTVGNTGNICTGSSTNITLSGSEAGINYQLIQGAPGLIANYYNYNSLTGATGDQTPPVSPVITQTEPNINDVYSYYGGATGPPSGVNTTYFTTIWTGYIIAPVTGTYTFSLIADDGGYLTINGVNIINHFTWGWSGTSGPFTGTINLTAGQAYPIRYAYLQGQGAAETILSWSYPGQPNLAVIPASQFYTNISPGQIIPGTGSALNFPVSAAGTYTVVATNTSTGCTQNMNGSSTITVVPPPTTSTVAKSSNNLCVTTLYSYLNGNTPSIGTGTWTEISGPNTVTIQSPNSGGSLIQGYIAGTYVLQWKITNGNCSSSVLDTIICQANTTPNPGPDQNLCNVTSTTMAGNTPIYGTGTWSQYSGPAATIVNPHSPNATITGLVPGNYQFIWTINFGGCGQGQGMIVNVYASPTTANAGPDQTFCNQTSTNLAGNRPLIGIGKWTQFSGPNTATIAKPDSALTSVTGLIPGTYKFVWTISNGSCASSQSTITVINNPLPNTYTVSGGGTYCSGGSGIAINLSGSQSGVNYQLQLGGVNAGSPVAGTGSPLIFTGISAGTYTILATNSSSGCVQTMSGNAQVSINPSVTLASSILNNVSCFGGTNGSLILSGAGGNGSYMYSIDNGTTYYSSGTFLGLSAGTYSTLVRDGLGCTSSVYPLTLTQPNAALGVDSVSQIQPSCSGLSNGSIIFNNAHGGTPPYQYSINGGSSYQSSNIFTGLATGSNYNLYVVDAKGCLLDVANSYYLLSPLPLTASPFVGQAPSCYGLANGHLYPNAQNGTPPYTYSLDGITYQSGSFLNVGEGTYTIYIKDAHGCLYTTSFTVTGPAPSINFTTSIGPSGCSGASTGKITVNASGGVAPLSYSDNGGASYQASNIFTGLSSGNYSVIVKDAGGCTSALQTITVSTANPITFTYTQVNPLCSGYSTGQITINATGGNGNYSYSINNGTSYQASNIFTGLAPGPYNIMVVDNGGCSSTNTPMTISQPFALGLSVSGTNISCYGGSNGSINAHGSGGTGTITYSDDGGLTYQSSNIFNGLSAGTYSIYIKDGNGCTLFTSITLTQPAALSASVTSHTNVLCFGNSTGTATISTGGGTYPYSFSWNSSPVQTTPTATGLPAGTYICTVTDGNACTTTASIMITQPAAALTASISSQTNVLCFGNSTGSATASPAGGTGPYTYSWNTSPVQTTATATGLPAGTYTVTIMDANNCSTTASVTITQPAAALTASISSQTNVLCFGNATGAATVSPSGGTGPYTYSWNTTPVQTTATATGLAAGTYTVTVTDAGNCMTTASATITQSSAITVFSISSPSNVVCSGFSTTVLLSGTQSGVNYQLLNNGVAIGPSLNGTSFPVTFQVNTSGTYTVLATNTTTGCTQLMSGSLPISVNSLPNTYMVGSSNTAVCAGSSTNITLSGSDNGVNYQLIQGTPGLTVQYYNSTVASGNLTPSGSPVVTQTEGNIDDIYLGYGGSTGFPSGVNLTNVTAIWTGYIIAPVTGMYTFSLIADDGGYLTVNGVTIINHYGYSYPGPSPGPLTGTISLVAGQSYPIRYAYNQTNGQAETILYWSYPGVSNPVVIPSTQFFTNVTTGSLLAGTGSSLNFPVSTAGTYTIIATNSTTGCSQTMSGSAAITVNPLPTLYTVSGTALICSGSSTIIVLSGSQTGVNYQLQIGGVNTGSMVAGTGSSLNFPVTAAGSYTVLATNTTTGCTQNMNGSAVITINPVVTISSTTLTNISCYGGANGSIVLVGGGGNGTYTYSINNGSNYYGSGTFNGLPAGTYQLIVKDGLGCTSAVSTITLSQPLAALMASISSQTDVLCFGNLTGAATASSSGGTGPYTYSWNTSPIQTTATATALAAGTYTVTVTDANNCSTTASVTITQPAAALTASISSQTNVLCFGNSTGTATVSPVGGTGPYTYSWTTSPVQTTATATGLSAGTYTVTVKDVNNCSTTASVTITQPAAALSASISNQTNVLCFGNAMGSATASPSGGTGPYTFSWNISPIQTTATATGLAAGTYTVTVTDANNCSTTASVTITQPAAALSSSISSQTNVLCFGNATGSATASPAGGTGPYTYSWNSTPVQTTATATGLAAGTYTVTIKDVNNCSTTASVTITQPAAALSASISSQTNVLCFGNATGAATVSPSGGTGPYTYSWNTTPVQTSATATGLAAGNYTLTVKDANNCSTTASVTITQPASALTASISSQTNVLCFGNSTGAATASPAGGSGPYTYSWNTSPVQTTATATALAAGAYTVTVKDANNCSTTASVTITQPVAALSASISSQTNVLCFANATGAATASPAGGTGPYTYSWNSTPVQTTATATGLAAGTYTVTVKDANNCSTTTSVTITQPAAALTASISSQTNVFCNGNATGSATVVAQGGVSPYSYSWNTLPVQTSATVSNVKAGTYTVMVSDSNHCTTTATVTITQPQALSASISSQTDVLCYGNATGSATMSPSGGTAPYSYSWTTSPVQTTATASGLIAGVYFVTVSDSLGCSLTKKVVIHQPAAPLSDNITIQTQILCYGNATGVATVTASGGSGSYTYAWNTSPVQTFATATGLSSGTYTVTITDGSGCSLTDSVTLGQPVAPLSAVISTQTPVSCYGTATGTATVMATGGTAPYSYSWNTPNVQTTQTAIGMAAGIYTVTLTDAAGCTTMAMVTITQPPAPLRVRLGGQMNVVCHGNSTGSAWVEATGGYPPYTYMWNTVPVQTGDTAMNLGAGSYTVIVTDGGGCSVAIGVTITESAALALRITNPAPVTQPFTVDITPAAVTSGSTPGLVYTYYQDSMLTQTLSNPKAISQSGRYYIVGTNGPGCTVVGGVQVTIKASVLPMPVPADTINTFAGIPVNLPGLSQKAIPGTYAIDPSSINFSPGTGTVQHSLTLPGIGTFTANASGTVVFIPLGSYSGMVSVPYSLSDIQGEASASTGNLVFVVRPRAIPDTVTTGTNTPFTYDVLAKDLGNLDPGSVQIVSNPKNGQVQVDPVTGTIHYVPNPGYAGTDSLVYTVCDKTIPVPLCSNLATLTFTVSAISDIAIRDTVPPVVDNDTYTYTILVTNNGPALATGIIVQDTLPNGVGFQKGKQSAGNYNQNAGNNSITWTIPSLKSGATDTLVITVNTTQLGSITNTVYVTSLSKDPDLANNISILTIDKKGELLTIPTLFSPNGDGINDTFLIQGLQDYPENTIDIFNRWGNQVYQAGSYMQGGRIWDGSNLSEGTYFYVLKVNINGTNKQYSGYTTIIRSGRK